MPKSAMVTGFNSVVPFTLIAWAALTLPASYLVILNAVSPMFSALAAALWLDERLTVAKLAGLAVGVFHSTADIAAQWESERVFSPQIDEGEREKQLAGWRRALERAMNWEEK